MRRCQVGNLWGSLPGRHFMEQFARKALYGAVCQEGDLWGASGT